MYEAIHMKILKNKDMFSILIKSNIIHHLKYNNNKMSIYLCVKPGMSSYSSASIGPDSSNCSLTGVELVVTGLVWFGRSASALSGVVQCCTSSTLAVRNLGGNIKYRQQETNVTKENISHLTSSHSHLYIFQSMA